MQSGSERVLTLEADFFCHLYIKNDTLKFKMPVTLFEDRAEDKIFWNMKGESVQNHKKPLEKLLGLMYFSLMKILTFNYLRVLVTLLQWKIIYISSNQLGNFLKFNIIVLSFLI